MTRTNLNDLAAFAVVARERSFTRAAAGLGVSPSALSHMMRLLEERLGVRLLARTTRSVTPTAAGERLLLTLEPRIDEIEAELRALAELRDKPAGDVRLTLDDYTLYWTVWPRLRPVLAAYPDINIEFITDYALTDIVAERFDGGIRLGGVIDKDMIAVPIGPDERMVVVAAPTYFLEHPAPLVPADLTQHNCIQLRLKTQSGVYAWEFEKEGREFRVRVQGQAMFNSSPPMLVAALDGFGIAYLPRGLAEPHLKTGRLVEVLGDWLPPFSGYHLYYPSRRQMTPAFAIVLDALRYRSSVAATRIS
ncbi:MAG TPA: LysR family transcriptional regulator [Stellaceae bacterium]|nr:LysR family transcriptional regulator [Stellaceae bacterium]